MFRRLVHQCVPRWRMYSMKPSIANIKIENIGKILSVRGWVRSVRKHKSVCFIDLNDGSTLKGIQIVCAEDDAKQLTAGCSIEVTGELVETLTSKNNIKQIEIQSHQLRILGLCDAQEYPLQKKGHSLEFMREIMHLRSRSNTFGTVMRIRNCLSRALHNSFQSTGFLHVHTPILTSNDAEGGGEQFQVSPEGLDPKDFFGCPTFLTVSGQLHAEIFASALSKVYTFGPTFRAENSNTSRHLAEFWMVEPEVAFADMKENLILAEATIKNVINVLLEECEQDIHFCNQFYNKQLQSSLETIVKTPFPVISYSDAILLLEKKKTRFINQVKWGEDLKSEHERYLAEEYCQSPVFITDYPSSIKPFYMKLDKNGSTVQCMDLLVPRIGELIGGSVREDDYLILRQRMIEKGMLIEGEEESSNLKWYLELRKFGSVPHAGWGLGFERLVQYVTGLDNIRDVIPIPRYPKSCKF